MGQWAWGGCDAWIRARAWMLVFSSAESTNSSSRNGGFCQTPSYRSNKRPALAAKSGSRGKIQQRCCQGLSAVSCSQRHTVASLMVATKPDWQAWRASSDTLQRASGTLCWLGNSTDPPGLGQHALTLAAMRAGSGCLFQVFHRRRLKHLVPDAGAGRFLKKPRKHRGFRAFWSLAWFRLSGGCSGGTGTF